MSDKKYTTFFDKDVGSNMNNIPVDPYDSEDKLLTVQDLLGKEIPQKVLESLVIESRIKFPLKPTSASAVSTSGEKEPELEDANISGLIDSIAEFEDQVEQLEDMSDMLLKDMSIPPLNDRIKSAVQKLDPGNEDGNITKEVLDTALAISDHYPIMSLGQDPILGILSGNGRVDGKWMNCNDFSKSMSESFETSLERTDNAEEIAESQGQKMFQDWEDKQQDLWLHIVLSMWWNVIWVRFVVDLSIINPIKKMVADPLDKLVLFFKTLIGTRNYRGKWSFKTPDKNQIMFAGPINKILNSVRKFLLCLPFKTKWGKDNYDPPVDPLTGKKFECKSVLNKKCGKTVEGGTKGKQGNNMDAFGKMLDDIFPENSNGDCLSSDDFLGNIKIQEPQNLGAPPECLNASKIVLDAVIDHALNPGNSDTSNIAKSDIATNSIKEAYKLI